MRNLAITEPQAAFLDATAPYRAFVGGRGAGKSLIGAYDLIQRAKPGRLYLVGSPTYTMLADSSLRTFKELARWLGVLKKMNESDLRATLGNGAEILFRSADNPDRWRGPNISGAWLDEAAEMDVEAFHVLIACLREAGEQGWLSATFTPRGLAHWTYDTFAKPDRDGKGPVNVALIRSTTAQNPFLPDGFEATIRQQYGSVRAAQELSGDFVDTEGALFKAQWLRYWTYEGPTIIRKYPDGRREKNNNPDTFRIFITVDLATSIKTTADFTVIAVWGDDRKGNLYLLDLVRERMEGPDIVPRIKRLTEHWKAQYVGIESTGYQLSTVQAARREGLPVRELKRKTDKVTRAIPATVRMEAEQVWLPENAAWLAEVTSELLHFPAGAHDDFVDVLADAANEMTELYSKTKMRTMPGLGVVGQGSPNQPSQWR